MSEYPTLTIITALSRPGYLPGIFESLNAAEGHNLDIRHYIIHPHGATHPGNGRADMARNVEAALSSIRDGWVWILDDDNSVHPGFFRRLEEEIAAQPEARAFVFSQERADERRLLQAAPENVRIGSIDTAQFVLRRDLIGDLRWCELPVHDGIFIQELYEQCPEDFRFVDEVLCYFNRQSHGAPRHVMVNLGCGTDVRDGWINIDSAPRAGVKAHDIRQGLPFFNNSIDYIYASHVLEHLDYSVASKLIDECHRALLPGGVVRLVLPDVPRLLADYVRGDVSDWQGFTQFVCSAIPGVEEPQPIDYVNAIIFNVARDPHRYVWDVPRLCDVLLAAGFATAEPVAFDSRIDIDDPFRTNHSFYVEAHKEG
jgi:predicted SAM-dependent methyltransferase